MNQEGGHSFQIPLLLYSRHIISLSPSSVQKVSGSDDYSSPSAMPRNVRSYPTLRCTEITASTPSTSIAHRLLPVVGPVRQTRYERHRSPYPPRSPTSSPRLYASSTSEFSSTSSCRSESPFSLSSCAESSRSPSPIIPPQPQIPPSPPVESKPANTATVAISQYTVVSRR